MGCPWARDSLVRVCRQGGLRKSGHVTPDSYWVVVKIMVPFLGPHYNTGPSLGYPKRDHNFDNPPYANAWASPA